MSSIIGIHRNIVKINYLKTNNRSKNKNVKITYTTPGCELRIITLLTQTKNSIKWFRAYKFVNSPTLYWNFENHIYS